MKKLLLIGGTILLLAGCASKQNLVPVQLEQITEEITISGAITEDSYNKFGANMTGCLALSGEAMADYECSEIKGYLHSYYASGIGVKITYDNKDQDNFFQKDIQAPISGGENIVYDIQQPEIFIKMINKDATKTPDEIMKTTKTPSGCIYTTHQENNQAIYALQSNDGNDTTCESVGGIITEYIFNQEKPKYYYQKNFTDACAPGPCNALDTTTELFLK